jgi:hypothetical protein
MSGCNVKSDANDCDVGLLYFLQSLREIFPYTILKQATTLPSTYSSSQGQSLLKSDGLRDVLTF